MALELTMRSQLKMVAFSGLAAVFLSGLALADSDAEILERIRPIGKVVTEQPAPPAVTEEAPAVVEAAAEPVAEQAPAAEAPAAEAAAAETAAAGAPDGKKIYDTACFACHMTGAANAPKLGDKTAWEARVAKGEEALLQSAINGIAGTAMPPRGTCATCSDDDLKAAVEYMVSAVQ
jgi:cytochrome c5